MERIQSAIEKARKERAQIDETPARKTSAPPRKSAPAAKADTAPAPLVLPMVDEAWKALPAFQPKARRLKHKRILAYQSCPEATAYDMARTKLLQQLRKHDWHRVAITSAGPGSGKTMTCLNLAFSLAMQPSITKPRSVGFQPLSQCPGPAHFCRMRPPNLR